MIVLWVNFSNEVERMGLYGFSWIIIDSISSKDPQGEKMRGNTFFQLWIDDKLYDPRYVLEIISACKGFHVIVYFDTLSMMIIRIEGSQTNYHYQEWSIVKGFSVMVEVKFWGYKGWKF